jgi:hypothetical protein
VYLNAVVKCCGGRGNGKEVVRRNFRIMPAIFTIPIYFKHVISKRFPKLKLVVRKLVLVKFFNGENEII